MCNNLSDNESNTSELPPDHEARMERALLSLDGLSVGDAFGEGCFGSVRRMQRQELPPSPWCFTDDTAMARSIVRCLNRYGHVDQDALAEAFAAEYQRNPHRGYGPMAQRILLQIGSGTPWADAAGRVFGGQGSCGNGGAMRSAPIGGYFSDDVLRTVAEANASAEIRHTHPDGKTGAMAVALAASGMVREAS